ncbi:MAG: hypothetical protein GY717_20830 [Rhodobacteraceae bacterium]|nr:hypothetical protein [Paracoccaceae bacterium]
MKHILALLAALAFGPAQARDLPQGEYLLTGNVLPAIREGLIVPVFVHLSTHGDRMDWSFVTAYNPDAVFCAETGKCHRMVQTLSHTVHWDDDGDLRVVSTDRTSGEGLVIDRASVDTLLIYAPLTTLIGGARLELSQTGGTLSHESRRNGGTEIELVPATLDQLLQAMAIPRALELSLALLDQCAIRQVLDLANDPDPTPAARELLLAARYLYDIEKNEAISSYYSTPEEIPPQERAAVEAARNYWHAARFPMQHSFIDAAEARIAGTPLSDEALLALASETMTMMQDELGADYDALAEEILVNRRAGLLAAIRFYARFATVVQSGADLQNALCADVTLGG